MLSLKDSEIRYRRMFETAQDGILMLDASTGLIEDVNPYLIKMLGYTRDEFVEKKLWEVGTFKDIEANQNAFEALQENEYIHYDDLALKTKSGRLIQVEFVINVYQIGNEKVIQCNIRDITERKQAEDALQVSEARFRRLVEHLPTVVYTNAVGNLSSTVYVSPQIQALMGYTQYEWLADPQLWSKSLHPEDRQYVLAQVADTDQNNKPFNIEYRMIARDGHLVWVQDQLILVNDMEGHHPYWQGIMLDITERKQADEKFRESNERFQRYFELGLIGMAISSPTKVITEVNEKICEILGYEKSELLGKEWAEFTHPDDLALDIANFNRVVAGDIDGYSIDKRWIRKDGQVVYSIIAVNCARHVDGSVFYFVALLLDITERKLAEARIQRQLDHLTALSTIDRVIAANFDIKLSLTEILNHVTVELGIDAADILILNPNLQMLEFGAERGFRTKTIRKTQIRLGEGYAGYAALERQLVQIPNLSDESDNLFQKTLFAEDDFVCYYGLPLITKGQVKGVLEIFHRSKLEPDVEWFDFLNTLAGQAAIAIENSTLFENLQRSNSELMLAYDATIEGWSHALDLRDKETEGHTQRVTEVTVKLARALGLSDDELVQVRWGALLHDIGKMGVPDGILLKPEPLTEEEWVLMRRHPTFAYEMLSPIRYLRNALEIPYCHHEKWDGSGYPRGLIGDQTPLVARIFAVVDVWDALKSDRPYRAGWTEEKVREHIRSLSGTHFDPQVVDEFLK